MAISEELFTYIQAIIFFTLLNIFIFSLTLKLGFYRLKPNQTDSTVSFRNVLQVFAIFFIVELFVAPLLLILWNIWNRQGIGDLEHISASPSTQGWINLIAIAIALLAMGCYCLFQKKELKQAIFGKNAFKGLNQAIKDFLFGVMTWLIAYPLIAWLGQWINLGLLFFYQGPRVEQVAVKQLKKTLSDPILFAITVPWIIIIVPIAEELIFRGFLQNWLKNILGTFKGIALTAAIFALFHFSESQGIDNLELLLSLFVLGCFLGFIYERQQSLWTAIGLHSTFNALSVLMILELYN